MNKTKRNLLAVAGVIIMVTGVMVSIAEVYLLFPKELKVFHFLIGTALICPGIVLLAHVFGDY